MTKAKKILLHPTTKKAVDMTVLGIALYAALIMENPALALGGVIIYLLGYVTMGGPKE